MTNVPEKIREAWKDVYVLFDTSYSMDGSDEAWKAYWDKANKLVRNLCCETENRESYPVLEQGRRLSASDVTNKIVGDKKWINCMSI